MSHPGSEHVLNYTDDQHDCEEFWSPWYILREGHHDKNNETNDYNETICRNHFPSSRSEVSVLLNKLKFILVHSLLHAIFLRYKIILKSINYIGVSIQDVFISISSCAIH